MMSSDGDRPSSPNPLLDLAYESAFEQLGDDYFDVVAAAEFPTHILRFRNSDVLERLGLQPADVTDEHFLEAFGRFVPPRRFGATIHPFLAMRYHGYQFGEYNPFLGDGRGFLYGQVRGVDGELYDFGTKGSGTTPYSRGGDGRLTLKGGVREAIASETLHTLGVRTSRCFSLIETGESLWRGDEPSPTRSSVMVRFSRSHIRFGTFERLHYLGRADLIETLLNHVIHNYYPHLVGLEDAYTRFYGELVQRTAELAAQWMSVGFCHAVLNTDNMSITGESFDYGPFAFIDRYDPRFTAAYFDHFGRYCYANQPAICRWNLEMLQVPLRYVIPMQEMDHIASTFPAYYFQTYRQRMLNKLGFDAVDEAIALPLLETTLQLLEVSKIGYHEFFYELRSQFSSLWRQDESFILNPIVQADEATQPPRDIQPRLDAQLFGKWKAFYHQALMHLPPDHMTDIHTRLNRHNPRLVPIRSEIEAIWEPITLDDNWTPFESLLHQIRTSVV
jgi:uncharacterized protein YdiU (UPF0061 family)